MKSALAQDKWYDDVKWHEDKDVRGTISNFVDSLDWADIDLYPNIRIILFISAIKKAIRPSKTASNERSFSTLKRLKTYLRSTMIGDRLNGLSLMNINQDIEIPAETKVDNLGGLGFYKTFTLNKFEFFKLIF